MEDDLEGVTKKVYFDVEIDGKLVGIILLLLFLITKFWFGYLFDYSGFWELVFGWWFGMWFQIKFKEGVLDSLAWCIGAIHTDFRSLFVPWGTPLGMMQTLLLWVCSEWRWKGNKGYFILKWNWTWWQWDLCHFKTKWVLFAIVLYSNLHHGK